MMPTEYVRWNGQWVEVTPRTTYPVLIDSFEDGDISAYTGDTGSFTVDQTSPVFDGSYSLKTLDAGSGTALLVSTSGLQYYPSLGDTFRAEIQIETNAGSPGIVFGAIDDSNHYFARLNATSTIELYKRSSGDASLIADDTVELAKETPYTVEIQWGTDDTITFRLLDSNGSELAQATGQDSEYSTESGFGWYNASGSGHNYDHARVVQ